jgi:hypothetical protein
MFQTSQSAGPFTKVAAFHDWLATLRSHAPPGLNVDLGRWRSGLLDNIPIVFTHADLHRSNIMVFQDANGIPQIAAIIDWHQLGWYPASWEFLQTRLTCKLPGNDQWELEFILEFLQAYRGYIVWGYFSQGVGLQDGTTFTFYRLSERAVSGSKRSEARARERSIDSLNNTLLFHCEAALEPSPVLLAVRFRAIN